MIETLLYSEINLLCIVLLGIMAYRSSKFGLDNNSKKLSLVAAIHCSIIVNISDIIWHLGVTGTIRFSHFTMYLANAVFFTALSAAAIFWFMFSEIAHHRKILSRTTALLLFFLPLFILFVLMMTTHYTGWFFTFDENGEYVRGPLFYLQFGLAFIYSMIATFKSLAYAYSVKNNERRETYVSLFAFGIPILICTVLQAIYQKLPILPVAPTIALLLTYTNSLKIQVSLDPLTGIYNRRMIVDELEHRTKSLKSNKKLYFIFMDIDGFKRLNDEYGHHEGDNALFLVARTLNEICAETDGFCARYGGDEFAVIQELNENENISDLCHTIEKRIEERSKNEEFKFPVSISVGYAEYMKDSDSVQSLIRFADKQMYYRKNAKSNDRDSNH